MWIPLFGEVPASYWALSLYILTLTVLVLAIKNRLARRLPPSPPGQLFIGHRDVLKIPVDYQWKTFADWAKQYGSVFYAHILGKPVVICNSFDSARELLEKRGSIYSDRPKMLAAELLGWGSLVVIQGYNSRWRKQRRILQKSFDQQMSRHFQPATEDELKKFIKDIENFDGDLSKKLHRFVTGTLSLAAYGHEVVSDDDELVAYMDEVSNVTNATGSPGSTPVDFLPILQYFPTWLPGMRFLKALKDGRIIAQKALTMPVQLVRKDREAGKARKSFIAELLDEYESKGTYDNEHEEDIAAMGGIIFIGGAETTEFTLYVFFLMMVLHPETVPPVRRELDAFVQAERRLPMFSERNQFPHVDAIIKEVYRINPAFPLCIPHRNMEEDNYEGYTIPKGSMIIPNIWQMMRDETYYPEPHRFLPERFLNSGKNPLPDNPASDPSKMVYGFGRRICPGRFFAEDVIWLTVSTVLCVYDILPSLDQKTGKPVLPVMEFTSGPMTTAKPYVCRIVPRS